MKKTVLRKYAHLIAAKGVNVQKGQEVFIQAEFDQPEFVKMLVEECYKLGAKSVKVDWTYQPLTKVHTRYMSLKTLGTLEDYEAARWQHYVNTIPCRIYLESEDPDGLKGLNQKKFSKALQKRMPIIRSYRDQIENKYQWCIAAVPGEKWAKKLFPELSKKQAVEKLWEAILSCARVTDDPIAAWDAHNKDLKERCRYLNSLGIDSLEYKSGNGTD
ncbi:MAG: aminopeptidase, partial [Firmicutes bacterium]|nr:aminopeptidase [Bacillota bacterium]